MHSSHSNSFIVKKSLLMIKPTTHNTSTEEVMVEASSAEIVQDLLRVMGNAGILGG